MEDPRIISALFISLKMAYYNVLINIQRYLPVTVTLFRAFRTDLPGYHTFLSLHPSAAFTAHDSV